MQYSTLALLFLGLAGSQAKPQGYGGGGSYGAKVGGAPKCSLQRVAQPNGYGCTTQQECKTDYDQECSTTYEQKCETKYKQKCQTKYENKCETKYDDKYEYTTETKCETKYEQQCKTEYEYKCEYVYGKKECKQMPRQACSQVLNMLMNLYLGMPISIYQHLF